MKRRILVLSVIPFLSIMVFSMILVVSSASADDGYPKGYADDRAQIEDLLARYMFAMDFNDPEGFAALFAEDAVLAVPRAGQDPQIGRAAILKAAKERAINSRPKPEAPEKDKEWIVAHRHFLANLVLKVEGDKAYGNAYYGHFANTAEDRNSDVVSYGHYTDEFIKVNGRWYISSRKWNTETRANYTPASKAFIDPTPSPY